MIKLKSLISETLHNISGQTLINVDVQPEYESYFGHTFLKNWIKFLNENNSTSDTIFLYNGHETLGMVTEQDYKYWLLENGLNENVIDSAIFYDKGYAFFRYCMDSLLDEDSITNFVKFMYENDINDSRDMDRNMWAKYLRQYRKTDKTEIYDLLKCSGDCVHIPDLMKFLSKFNNLVLTGGGINECLKEVEISLKALGKKYSILNKFTY